MEKGVKNMGIMYQAGTHQESSPSMTMHNYIIEFEKSTKLKEYDIVLTDAVLAYRLLKSANITEVKEQLARVSLTELKLKNMKDQLKKIFNDTAVPSTSSTTTIKIVRVMFITTTGRNIIRTMEQRKLQEKQSVASFPHLRATCTKQGIVLYHNV